VVCQQVPVLGYIDPSGGLPPSVWGAGLAPLLAAFGLIALGLKLLASRCGRLMRRHRVALLAAVLLCGGAVVVWLAERRHARQAPAGPRRVVVLCLDGLDPLLLRRYMEQGRLPSFRRLARAGVFHELRTTNPPQSPVAWASFITGTDPCEHGLFDFIRRDPRRYALELATCDRRRPALPWRGTPWWEAPALRGWQVVALRVPLTFPPPRVNGRLLCGMGVWDARGTEGTYFYYTTGPLPESLRGIALPLRRDGERLRGELPGPYQVGEAEEEVRLPFSLVTEGEGAALSIQGSTYPLRPGRWSDWIALEFRTSRP